ncbi:MAG: metalloregulator ArsR/SmtB family transcription factor [Pseudomonadota bacterium]
MVMNEASLNQVFSALSDPTRRGMLAQLAEGEANVRSLAQRYEMSQPAISKHLRVLESAGLITRTKRGRENIVRVDPRPIEDARTWIGYYARFWRQQFDDVEQYLQAKRTAKKK